MKDKLLKISLILAIVICIINIKLTIENTRNKYKMSLLENSINEQIEEKECYRSQLEKAYTELESYKDTEYIDNINAKEDKTK